MDVDRALDHLFRRCAGQMVAALARVVGADRIDLAEEVVQDALVRALEVWRYRGVPDNPRGWLYRVAYHRALDLLRRDTTLREKLALLPPPDAFDSPGATNESPLADDELALIFLCCHPVLPPDTRVALTLKVAGGFSVQEIGAALLTGPGAIAQRIARAKRALRDRGVDLAMPRSGEAMERLDSVLVCLYLLFTEGHNAHGGDEAVREDLCFEAIRLGELLAAHPATDRPAVHALLALMYLQASRLRARCEDGDLILLDEQDRGRWDERLASAGMRHLDVSARGDELTTYHVEAAIAAEFASGDADWTRVLRLYDPLLALSPTPVVRMNRAVALGKVEGPKAALPELVQLLEFPAMRRYHLLPALLGEFYREAGLRVKAGDAYRAALRLRCNAAERRLIEGRLRALQSADAPFERTGSARREEAAS
ncbi:MAG: RNA polymerase sigma factor [Gemmatimonadota bacterium]